MKDSSLLSPRSPFVYFWLGILTGALIVIASFMLRSMSYDGGASVLPILRSTPKITAPAPVVSPATLKGINTPGTINSINTPGTIRGINTPGT